ncbi:MAG: MG2 domain-containing protein, partial [Bacteroidota bacterium]
MLNKLYLILLSSFILPLTLAAQQSYAEPLDDYAAKFLPEKTFVHTDKNIYAGGETVHAAIYLFNGISHQPDSLSKTIYLELVNPADSVINRLSVFAADGHAAASITLPATIVPGDYQLAAYTNFQRNGYSGTIFRKVLRIVGGLKESGGVGNTDLVNNSDLATPPAETELIPTLRFFPESGDCAKGIPCRIAVVSALENGTPVPFSGTFREEGQ